MSNAHVHDPDLLDALEAIEPVSFDGVVWRVSWATREPLAGGTGGGRWHPANDFQMLYTSIDKDGAIAEVHYHLSKQPVFSSSNVKISRIRVKADRTLSIPDTETLAQLGVETDAFKNANYSRTKEIGAAARFLDFFGLLVPSARWDCSNLALILDRKQEEDVLIVEETNDLNWPEWQRSLP